MEKSKLCNRHRFSRNKPVKRLEVYNVGAITLTKIASTQINRLRCDPHKKKESVMLGYTVSDISLPT